ncbi:hypothetical protein AAX29_00599 [Aliarcobacter thereius]|uniref:Uncharacterized protein n=1 Tax=Aliarcobacter thereius TaxID=544718 RepID=A0A1C0B7I1_9BACT|nr:hypothetical protein [Aliarcobacter thereius]OCL99558.1 hypothetical protein AAX29_00599 [Aliarcobacter thereius]
MNEFKVEQIWIDGTGHEINIVKIDNPGTYPIVGYDKKLKISVSYLESGRWSDNNLYKEFDLKELKNE